MNNDFSFYNVYSDIVEDGMIKRRCKDKIDVSYYDIKRRKGHFLKGFYTLICFDNIIEEKNYKEIKKVVKRELNYYIKGYNNVLIVGLGNPFVTPDSLGPKVIEDILVTGYLEKKEDGFCKTYALAPSVEGVTGIKTKDYISSLVKKIKPELVIFIDSFSSKNKNHLCKAIQISDAGIFPGSSEKINKKNELSKKTLHTNTVVIGVPTVVDTFSIFLDMVSSYDIKRKPGKLDSFLVTPKEIDFQIRKLSFLISSSINECLHKAIH